jgi:uncharacterized protein (DUF58 family)
MRPGRRLPAALALLAALAILVPVDSRVAWALAVALVALVLACLAEAVMLSAVALAAERPAAVALPLDEVDVVSGTLRSSATWPLAVVLRQAWPPLLAEPASVAAGTCEPGHELRVDLAVRGVARGASVLERPFVAATRWGLVERVTPVGEPARLAVIPNLRVLQRVSRKLDQLVLRGLGSRFSPKLGKGREFDRLRDHVTGDEWRDIAWKPSARHARLITREFRLDRSQDVLACVDRGHRMAARVGQLSKLDHAVNALVALAWACHRMEDRVGVLAFGAEVDRGLAQGRGVKHLRQVSAFATGVAAEYVHSDYLALAAHVRRRLRHRTLVLVMTALPEAAEEQQAVLRATRLLLPQHLPLFVVLTDPDLLAASRALPADEDELCRALVAKELVARRQQAVRELRRLGAMVVEAAPGETGEASVNAYLAVKRRQLL